MERIEAADRYTNEVITAMGPLLKIPEFEVLSRLGYGARSTIYAVSEISTGNIYALKHIIRHNSDDDSYIQQARHEYEISNQLDHPILRKCYRLILRHKLLKIAELRLVMEMFNGVILGAAPPTTLHSLLNVFSQVAKGLEAMHVKGLVHADIKPKNILINAEKQCKIIDFGQSCVIGTAKSHIQGTPDYIAPEQAERRRLTPATDVFSFGASLYWCITERNVPTVISQKKLWDIGALPTRLIQPYDLNPRIPFALSELIMDCVKYRPTDRPDSMKAVHGRLQLILAANDDVKII